MLIPASCLSRALVLSTLAVLVIGAGPASASHTACAEPAGATTTFHAEFAEGRMSLGSARADGLCASACGAVTGKPKAMMLTVQPRDIKFSDVSVKVLFFNVPSSITANAPLSGPFKFGSGFASAEASLATNMSASARVLGFTCVIGPLTLTLTTGKSGSLQGTTFTGSLKNGFTGKVVANDFAVPAIQRSKTCPWLIAKLSNAFVGLPAAPGKASISMKGSLTTP